MYETWEDFNYASWKSAVEDAKKRKDYKELEELLRDEDDEQESK